MNFSNPTLLPVGEGFADGMGTNIVLSLAKAVKHCLRKGAAGLVLESRVQSKVESRSAQYELVAPGTATAASQQSRIFCRDPPPSPPPPLTRAPGTRQQRQETQIVMKRGSEDLPRPWQLAAPAV